MSLGSITVMLWRGACTEGFIMVDNRPHVVGGSDNNGGL